MVRWDYLEAPLHLKEEWRYVPTEPGGQCVASLPGGSEKLMLSVGNLDTVCLVRINRRRAIKATLSAFVCLVCWMLLIHSYMHLACMYCLLLYLWKWFLLSESGARAYVTTTDTAHPVMFSYIWCSGSEFSITDCSGGIPSSTIVTCGQSVWAVQCRGKPI